MKKESLLQTFIPLLFLSAGGAYADSPHASNAPSDLDSRISILEAQMNEISTQTAHGNFGAKLPSASPQILGENWFFTADLLWWHVNEGGNDYAIRYKGDVLDDEHKGLNRKLKFKWDYGFRAGIGKTFQHDRWDLYLNFTWFQAKNSAACSLRNGTDVIALIGSPVAEDNTGTQAKIHWGIHFYTLDLNLGRNYFISPKVAFHPFAGIKAAWIDQSQRASSKVNIAIPAEVTHIQTKGKNRFWGVGPDLGLESKWFIGNGFNLFGSMAGALLWSDFHVRQKQTNSLDAVGLTTNSLPYSGHFDLHTVTAMTQMQIGVGYETNLYHNQYHLAINARYEQQYFWGQNQMPYFPSDTNYKYKRLSEDLSLQGLTVDVRFDF